MASRKDLLKAQSFTTGRLVASFVNRDPDNVTGPLRRVGTATFVGVMIGVLVLAIVALVSYLRPGQHGTWKNDAGALVADVNSGLLFVYYKQASGDEVLMPMADVATARLAIGGTDIKVVKTDKLQGISQDVMRGIAGAPRQLPAPSQMSPYPTRVCSTAPNDRGQRYNTVEVGKESSATPTTVADDQAVVVQTTEGEHYLVVNGHTHHLINPPAGAGRSPVVPYLAVLRTSNSWLAALPTGAPITPFELSNRGGTPSANQATPQLEIGSLVKSQPDEADPEPHYFIQLADGLAETSFLNMATELVDQGKPVEPIELPAQLIQQNMSPTQEVLATEGIPMGRPAGPSPEAGTSSVCATYVASDTRTAPVITVGQPTPELPAAVTSRDPDRQHADFIDVDPLHGLLLQDAAITAELSDEGPTFLVADAQVYGIPDQASRVALGYATSGKDRAPVLRVPAGLITLMGEVRVKLAQDQITPALPADFGSTG